MTNVEYALLQSSALESLRGVLRENAPFRGRRSNLASKRALIPQEQGRASLFVISHSSFSMPRMLNRITSTTTLNEPRTFLSPSCLCVFVVNSSLPLTCLSAFSSHVFVVYSSSKPLGLFRKNENRPSCCHDGRYTLQFDDLWVRCIPKPNLSVSQNCADFPS